ncbi:conjugal transfer protein [Pseudolactococcus yaeyamensis]
MKIKNIISDLKDSKLNPKNYKKQSKLKAPTLKKSGAISRKVADTVAIAVFGVLIGLLAVGTYRTIKFSSSVSKTSDEVVEISKKLNKLTSNSKVSTVNEIKLSNFVNQFTKIYINYSNNGDYKTKRQSLLKKCFAKGFDYKDESSLVERKYKTSELIDTTTQNDLTLAKVRVSYQEIENKKTTDQEKVLVIPVSGDDVFTVMAYPYFAQDSLVSGSNKVINQRVTDDDLPLFEKQEVTKFTEMFFKKYAESNEDELKLLMKTPELMGTGFNFVTLHDTTIQKLKDIYTVQTVVTYKDDNGLMHDENYTLELMKQKNSYFISTLYHYYN